MRYKKVDYAYFGKPHFIGVTKYYDTESKITFYVTVDKEGIMMTTLDFNEGEHLKVALELGETVLHQIPIAELTTDPELSNTAMRSLTSDENDIVWDCWKEYIRSRVANDNDSLWQCRVDQLPPSIYDQMYAGYQDYLSDHDRYVTTDGYSIIYEKDFLDTMLDGNAKVARDMQKHLDKIMPADSEGDKAMLEFYNSLITIAIAGKTFTFDMEANIYNALWDAAQSVVDNY